MTQRSPTPKMALAILALVLTPLAWLWPSVLGDRTFVPYDVNQFPPSSITATDAELQHARDGGNYDVTEVPVWFAPEMTLARDELRAGRLPSWNPNARSGAPLHAHGLIGLLYPPNWLALFADEPASRLGLVAWCNLALAGLLAFGLFRHVRCSVGAAWLAATFFQMSGTTAANSFFWMRLASFVWLPGVLWAMCAAARGDTLKVLPTIAIAWSFAMTWLAGFPPFAASTTIFAGALFVWLTIERLLSHGRGDALHVALRLGLGLALGAAWSLPQVLPSLAFFPESARPTTPEWSHISGQAFESYGLLGYLMPDAFGNPTMQSILPYGNSPMQLLLNTRMLDNGDPALPNYNFTEYSVFLSSLGILLAVVGLFSTTGRRAWFARTALALALGLGLFVPGMHLLFHLPVVQNVWPFRWVAAGSLFVTWLAAIGADRVFATKSRVSLLAGVLGLAVAGCMWWATGLPERMHKEDPDWIVHELEAHYNADRTAVLNHVLGEEPNRIQYDRFAKGFEQFAIDGMDNAMALGGIALLLIALGLIRRKGVRDFLFLAAAGASITQLGMHGATFTQGANHPGPKDSAAHQFLRDKAKELASSGGFAIVRTSVKPGRPDALPPGQLMHQGIHDLNFYSHGDARTLQPVKLALDTYHELLQLPPDAGEALAGKGYLTQSLPAGLLRLPLFDLLGVRFVLTTQPKLAKGPFEVGPVVGPEVRGRGQLFIHERPSALPRAFVAHSLQVLDDDDQALEQLISRTLEPRQQAFVVRSELPDGIAATAPVADERGVSFVRNDPSHIELDVQPGQARHLVLADTFLPGWTATIDDEPADVIRCNHCQRLVVLPENACRVTFRYEPPGLTMGIALMCLGTLSAIAAGWWLRRRERARVVPA